MTIKSFNDSHDDDDGDNDDASSQSSVSSLHDKMETSTCIQRTGLYRQSSVISTSSTVINDKSVLKKTGSKLIRSKSDLMILISIAMIYFIGMCAFSMIAPFFPGEAKQKGTNETIIGLIFAVYPFVVFLVSPFIGKYMPVIGVRFTLVAGCFLEAGSEILFGFVSEVEQTNTFILLCFAIRVVTAVGSAMSQTAVLSINSVTFKENLSVVMGLLEVFSGFGLMAGPTVGGVLYKVGGFKLPFIVVGGFVLVVLLCVYLVLPGEEAFSGVKHDDESAETGSFFSIFLIPGVFMLTVITVSGGMVLSFLDPTLTNHLEVITNKGLTSEKVGLIFMIAPGLYTLCAPVVGLIADKKIQGMYLILIGNLFVAIAYFLLGPSPIIIFLVPEHLWVSSLALVILGFGVAPCFIPVLYNMQLYTRKRGIPDSLATSSILSGIFNSGFSVGSVVGPTLGGVLTTHISFNWASTIFSFVLLAQLLSLIVFMFWEKCSAWIERKKSSNEGNQPILETC